MKMCIIYLASPRLFTTGCNNTGHSRYIVLKASLMCTRRVLPNMDIIVFHEDYTDEDIRNLPSGIVFEKIDFSGFEDIYNRELSSRRGYLMMCRFFSGVVQTHPKLQGYTHYIRMDDDSYFLEPYITDELIQQFSTSDYVFRSVFRENKPQQSLYEFTMQFIDRQINIVRKTQIKNALVSRGFINRLGQYSGVAPYNNFHMSSLRIWSHPLIRSYIESIERSGGIFRYGWLDANIHAMIINIFPFIIPELSIKSCTSFGYRHNHHVSKIGNVDIICDETIPFYPTWLDTTILPEEHDTPTINFSHSNSIVFTTFANTDYMPLDRIVSYAKNFGIFDQIYPHTELDFPAFFEKHREFIHSNRLNGFGLWIWKPMMILERLLALNPGDILVYTDAGVHLNKQGVPRFIEYISMLKDSSKSIVSFATFFKNNYYAHPDAIASYFPEFKCENYNYHYAGTMIVKHSESSIKLIQEWLSLCENYTYLSHTRGDRDNGLYNLCLSKHSSIVQSIYPDEVQPENGDWLLLKAFPFHYRRIRPSR